MNTDPERGFYLHFEGIKVKIEGLYLLLLLVPGGVVTAALLLAV